MHPAPGPQRPLVPGLIDEVVRRWWAGLSVVGGVGELGRGVGQRQAHAVACAHRDSAGQLPLGALLELVLEPELVAAHLVDLQPQLAHRGLLGKPLRPATINNVLVALRTFFVQLQETPHRVEGAEGARVIPRRFNPTRSLATPRAMSF